MSKVSLPKEKIKILLLEGLHQSTLDTLHANGYENIECLKTSLPEEELIDCWILSYKHCRHQVDHVVICGELTLGYVPPVPFQYNKMMCMRIQTVVAKNVQDSSIVKLHNNYYHFLDTMVLK